MTRLPNALFPIALLIVLQPSASWSDESPGLGELSFPNSGAEAAQEKFLIGVKLLHNFEYEEARETFRACQKIDPTFAMAFWGEAMCANHPLWGEQDLSAARAILKRLANTPTGPVSEREEGFLRTVRLLFGEGEKAERDERYLTALTELAERYPDDHEVACFHALAMLGTCGGERDTRVYMRAAGVLEDVYRENPRHPGALHYLIHCYDDPVHAPLGLRAARTYGAIAGNSAHAKHMPSHIYLALGMWDEMIESNEAAWQAGIDRLKRLQLEETDFDIHALHALQWLQYGYLQRGDYGRAFALLETMTDIHGRKPTDMNKWYFALMRAAYVVDAPDWRKANMDIDMTGVELSATVSNFFADGLAAIRQDTTGAERALERIIALRADAERKIKATAHHHSSYFDGVYATSIRASRLVETQLEALILLADGETDRAVARLQDAVAAEERLPTGYGPPLPVKPSLELLAEVLLILNRAEEAERAFQEALQRTPRRTAALVGLAEAAARQGHTDIADRARQELTKIRDNQRVHQTWSELPLAK